MAWKTPMASSSRASRFFSGDARLLRRANRGQAVDWNSRVGIDLATLYQRPEDGERLFELALPDQRPGFDDAALGGNSPVATGAFSALQAGAERMRTAATASARRRLVVIAAPEKKEGGPKAALIVTLIEDYCLWAPNAPT